MSGIELGVDLEHRQELHPTEVLDNMKGFRKFWKREGERNYDPTQADIWIVAGLSGVGKTIVAGQLRVLIEGSKARAKKLSEAKKIDANGQFLGDGKSPFVAVYPWDSFLTQFVEEDPTKIWGNLPIDDYNLGGEDMAQTIQQLKTVMLARKPDVAPTFILPLPLFTGSRGGAVAFNALRSDNNLRVIALVGEGQVLERAAIIRDALRVSKTAYLDALRMYGVKIDKELTDEEYERQKFSMGTRDSIKLHEEDLNIRILEHKDELIERELRINNSGLPDFDSETLESDPGLRIMLQHKYFDYYLAEGLRIPGRYLVTQNVFLDGEINFYASKLQPPTNEELPVNL